MAAGKIKIGKLDLISKRFDDLFELPERHDVILLNHVRKEFRTDLQQFIIGETLHRKAGKLVIGKNLYRNWLRKLKIEGFDQDIHFNIK